MLKNLFNRIKSEKSEALSSQKEAEIQSKLEENTMKPIESYQFSQLS